MEGDRAVEIFEMVKQKGMLPGKIEDLVPLSFIGQSAVSFYREKIKLMDKLNMTEEQRKATLRDGQDAGELLLDIEKRIGEIAAKEKTAVDAVKLPDGKFSGRKPVTKKKHERLGMNAHRMHQSQQIAKHPEIVERVKARAKEADDIPTRTAVMSEIRLEKERARRKAAEEKIKPNAMIAVEQLQYINCLDKCISVLPKQPPKNWSENALKEAKAKAQIICKRLEVLCE